MTRIMLRVNGDNIWTRREGESVTPEDLYDVLINDGIAKDTAYHMIGMAAVCGGSLHVAGKDVFEISYTID